MALESITDSHISIHRLGQALKGFDAYLAGGQNDDSISGSNWDAALDRLWECLEEHAHHEPG